MPAPLQAQTGEPRIQPLRPEGGTESPICELRDRFVEEHGGLEVDLELPPRTVEPRKRPFWKALDPGSAA